MLNVLVYSSDKTQTWSSGGRLEDSFLRVATENDIECFLSSWLDVLLPVEVLVEKDWGRVRAFFLEMEGDVSGELVKTEESEAGEELSSELLEDVLSKELVDDSEYK
ncbi:UNVERIFIED_CONTAM: hypothetical protein K2H54_061467 [Gekko kuhli]